MIINDYVDVTLSSKNMNWFMLKGYKTLNLGSVIKVKPNDLMNGSTVPITIKCDNKDCCRTFKRNYSTYLKCKEKHNHLEDFCSECIRNKKKEVLFKTIENVFNELDYMLISDIKDYKNSKSKLKFICNKHFNKGILEITWSNLKQGHCCKYCGNENTSRKLSFDFEFVKEEFIKREYILLDTSYKQSKIPLRFICPNHPDKIQKITYSSLKKGHGCLDCAFERIRGEGHGNWKGGIVNLADNLRNKLQDWKQETFEKYDYKCLITDKSNDLEIHHLYNFNKIVKEALIELNLPIYTEVSNYTKDQFNELVKKVQSLHNEYGLGVVLHKDIHKEFHKIYGKLDNTPEQFNEFKKKYMTKEMLDKFEKEVNKLNK